VASGVEVRLQPSLHISIKTRSVSQTEEGKGSVCGGEVIFFPKGRRPTEDLEDSGGLTRLPVVS